MLSSHEPVWISVSVHAGTLGDGGTEPTTTACSVCGLHKSMHERYAGDVLEDAFSDELAPVFSDGEI